MELAPVARIRYQDYQALRRLLDDIIGRGGTNDETTSEPPETAESTVRSVSAKRRPAKVEHVAQECQRELTSLVAQLMTTLLVDDENVVDGQPVVSGQDGVRYE